MDYQIQDYMRHSEKDDMTLAKGLLSFAVILSILAFCVFISA